jgi:hypothetical protein
VQRRALSVLFCGLAAALILIAAAAIVGAGDRVGRWIVAFAALALGGWLGSLGVSGLRR